MTEQPDKIWIDSQCKFKKCYYRQHCIEEGHTCAAIYNTSDEKTPPSYVNYRKAQIGALP